MDKSAYDSLNVVDQLVDGLPYAEQNRPRRHCYKNLTSQPARLRRTLQLQLLLLVGRQEPN